MSAYLKSLLCKCPALLLTGLALTGGNLSAGSAQTAPAPLLRKVGEYRLQNARYGAAAVAVGDSVYVIGGGSAGAVTDIERFNIHTHTIERVCDQLLPRRFHNAIEYRGLIYIFGGQGYGLRSRPFEENVEIFDPVTRRLSRGTPMPAGRAHMAVARLGAMVCLAGGTKMKTESEIIHTGDLDFYDLRTNTWSKGPPMPTAREAQAVAVSNFLVVPGGFRQGGRLATIEMFVPQENVWKSLPPLARKLSGHSLVTLDRYLFLLGEFSELNSILAYDLTTRTSTTVEVAGFHGSRHSSAATVENRIYFIGGNGGGDNTTALDLIQVLEFTAPRSK